MGRGRGPGKFLNFNQVAFERVWLLLKERERLILTLGGVGGGMGSGNRGLFAGGQLRDTQAGGKSGVEEWGPISLGCSG